MMFAYGPELYELQSWSTAGDANYFLDSHIQAGILLSHKMACMCDGAGPNDPSPSRAASPAGSAVLNSPAHSPGRSHSCYRTPSCKTKMERSCSSSMSSTCSQEVKSRSPAGLGDEDSSGSDSTSQEGNETDEEDEASSDGKASGMGKGSDGRSFDSEDSDGSGEIADHDEGAKESNSKAEGSDAESSSSSLETDGEIPTRVATPVKETKGGTPMKEAKGGNPNSSQMLSLPDLDSKDTEEEWKVQWCKDAQFLDRNFGKWHDCMINEGHAEWNKHDTMICDHTDPCKKVKFPDPASPPLEYMKHRRVFKPKKTDEYDLCCFYKVGLSGDLPSFSSPHEPATHKLLSKFLLKDQGARASQSCGGIHAGFCHSHLSFARTAHQRQPQAPANEPKGRHWWKGYQEAVLLLALYVFRQQQNLIHEPHHVKTPPCKL